MKANSTPQITSRSLLWLLPLLTVLSGCEPIPPSSSHKEDPDKSGVSVRMMPFEEEYNQANVRISTLEGKLSQEMAKNEELLIELEFQQQQIALQKATVVELAEHLAKIKGQLSDSSAEIAWIETTIAKILDDDQDDSTDTQPVPQSESQPDGNVNEPTPIQDSPKVETDDSKG